MTDPVGTLAGTGSKASNKPWSGTFLMWSTSVHYLCRISHLVNSSVTPSIPIKPAFQGVACLPVGREVFLSGLPNATMRFILF